MELGDANSQRGERFNGGLGVGRLNHGHHKLHGPPVRHA
jgi:hypothetical protein